ncbi:MAG: acyl-CoA dehydrogenase family protein, partial [Brevibacterium aurantiacum]
MAFDISTDEQDLVDAVAQISRDVLVPQAAVADANERVSDETLKTLAEVGVLGLNLPEEFG